MKINRNNKFTAAGLAAIAVAGLTIGASACSGSEATDASEARTEIATEANDTHRTDDVSNANDASEVISASVDGSSVRDDEPAIDEPGADDTGSVIDTPIVDAPVGEDVASDGASSDVPATDTPATDAETPSSDAPESDSPVEIPSGDTAPGTGGAPTLEIPMNSGASVEMILFVGSTGDLDASLFLKESGFGVNDIVSVKLVYYVGGTKTTTGATLSSEVSSIRSIWNAKNMRLSSGDSVSVRVTNSKGVTTYTDVVVSITAAM
jgi:hypothetical protein